MAEFHWQPDEIDQMHPYWLLIALGYRAPGSVVAMTDAEKRDILLADKRKRDATRNPTNKPPPFKPR